MEIPDTLIQEVADKALAYAYRDPRLAAASSRVARDVAFREARRALRREIRPFMADEPPARATSPPAAFFEIPLTLSPEPVLPVRTSAKSPTTPAERAAFAREFFKLVFFEERSTLEDFSPQRTRVAYRLLRELARHTRVLDQHQTLQELDASAWTRALVTLPGGGAHRARTRACLSSGPLSLLPPAAPDPLPADYDPALDLPLVHYCQALQCLAEDLSISAGTQTDPNLGRYGILGLLSPLTVRLACPSPEELLAWERTLISDALSVQLSRGTQGAYAWLEATHGLHSHEGRPILKAASTEAMERTEGDLEEKRAVMTLRLQDLARRARKSLNLPVQLGAAKLESLVAGFARSEPENLLSEFVNVVRKVNAEEDTPSIPAISMDDTDKDEDDEEAA